MSPIRTAASTDAAGQARPRPARSPHPRSLLFAVAGLLVTAPALAQLGQLAQPAPTDRIVVRLDSGLRSASHTIADTGVFPANLEQGRFRTDYDLKDGRVVDGGASFLLWRNLAIGLDVSNYRSIHDAQIHSELPHPFFFDAPRASTAQVAGLERRDLGIHIRALWMSQVAGWLVVSVSAGPSVITARQDLVSAVQHTEVGFPFDEIVFAGQTVSAESETTAGLNAGIDIDSFFLHRLPFLRNVEVLRHVGLGLLVRYVRATAVLQSAGEPIELDLGGVQITSGVRFRF